MGVHVAPPSQSLEPAKFRVRLEAPVAFGERNERRSQATALGTSLLSGVGTALSLANLPEAQRTRGRARPADACVGSRAFSFTRTSSPNMSCHGAGMSHCPTAICCPIYRSCGCRRCEIVGGSDACLLSRLSTTKIDLLEDSSRK